MQLASFRITNGGRKTIGAFVGHCYVDLHALTGAYALMMRVVRLPRARRIVE